MSTFRTGASAPGRLDVGVVGAGRVGSALGAALARAGHRLVAVSAGRFAERLRELGAAVLPADEVAAAASLLLLTVPDEQLEDLAAGLAGAGRLRPGTLVAHASGRFGLGVLEPLRAVGARPLALHPAMTFTGGELDLARLAGASFGVTTGPELRVAGEALVVEMGGEPVWVDEGDRALYHAALAHGANHLVTLVGQAAELLRGAGVADPAALLGPLLGAALDNALRWGEAALTGPVVRGDAGALADHLEALAGRPEQAAYRVLARATADRALAARRLPATTAASLLAVLAEPPR